MSTTTPAELDRINAELKKKLDLFKSEFAAGLLTTLRQKTPVVTGRLRAGWTSEVKKDVIEVGNDVDYVMYVELGTHKMAPRGMLRATIGEAEQIAEEARQKVGLE